MNITVFGANGRIGRLVVDRLLVKGHRVTGFVHRDGGLPTHPQLTVVVGDVHDAADVAAAIQGSDAVISALGSWGTKSKDILTAGMTNIIPAMRAAGVRRIVSLTGADAWDPTDKPSIRQRIMHSLLQIFAQKILRDGERHIELLRASDLDWTVVRSPVMKDAGDAAYTLSTKPPQPWVTIPRAAVVAALVDSLGQTQHIQASPYLAPAPSKT